MMALQVVELRLAGGPAAPLLRSIRRAAARQGVERVELRRALDDPDRVVVLVHWAAADAAPAAGRAQLLRAVAEAAAGAGARVLHRAGWGRIVPGGPAP